MDPDNSTPSPQEATRLLHHMLRMPLDDNFPIPGTKLLRELLEAGADINSVEEGYAPIQHCLLWDYRADSSDAYRASIDSVILLLLDAKPDLNVITPDGLDVFDLAERWQDGGALRNRLVRLMTPAMPDDDTPAAPDRAVPARAVIAAENTQTIIHAQKKRDGVKFRL